MSKSKPKIFTDSDSLMKYVFPPRARKPKPSLIGKLVVMRPTFFLIDAGDVDAFVADGISDSAYNGHACAIREKLTRKQLDRSVAIDPDHDRIAAVCDDAEFCHMEVTDTSG